MLNPTLLVALLGALASFSSGMSALVGHRAEEAFAVLGYPDDKIVIGEDTVYRWGADQPVGPSCTFKIVVSHDGTIKRWDGYGNSAGCKPYARALKRWRKGQ